MKTITKIALSLLLAACGGEPGELFPDVADAGPELGSAEQGYSIKRTSAGLTWGTNNNAARSACNFTGPSSQKCHFIGPTGSSPTGIQIRVEIDPNLYAGAIPSTYAQIVDSFCASIGSVVNNPPGTYPWSCQVVTSGGNIYVQEDAQIGVSTSVKADYIAPGWGGCSADLPTSGPNYPNQPGTMHACANATVFFRARDLFWKTALWSSSQRERAFRDVLYHGILAAVGHGSVSTLGQGAWVLATHFGSEGSAMPGFLNTSDACRMRSISIAQLTFFNYNTGC